MDMVKSLWSGGAAAAAGSGGAAAAPLPPSPSAPVGPSSLDEAVRASFARSTGGADDPSLQSSGEIARDLLMDFFRATSERMMGDEVRTMLRSTVISVHASLEKQGIRADEPRGANNVSQNLQAKIVLVQWEELKKMGVAPEWGYAYLFKRPATSFIAADDMELQTIYAELKQRNTAALTMAIIGPEAMKFTLKIEKLLKPVLAERMELPLDELKAHLDSMATESATMVAVATMQAKQAGGPPAVSAYLQTLSEPTALKVMEFVNLKRWAFAKEEEVAETAKRTKAEASGLQISGTIDVEKLRQFFTATATKVSTARTRKKLRAYFTQTAQAKGPQAAQSALQNAIIKIQMDVLKSCGIFGEWGYQYIYNRSAGTYIDDGDEETMDLYMKCKKANSDCVQESMMGKEMMEKQRGPQDRLMAELTPQLAKMSKKQRRKFKEKLTKKCGPLMSRLDSLDMAGRQAAMRALGPQERKNFQTLQIVMGFNV